jgi:hypothetical protein
MYQIGYFTNKKEKQLLIDCLLQEKYHTINCIKEIDNSKYFSTNVYFSVCENLISRVNKIHNLLIKIDK